VKLADVLRIARQEKGVTLERASEHTKIRQKFLRALEAGDYEALPGAIYTRGFLRSYGEYLDLKSDELVALFKAERGGPEPPQRLEPLRPIGRRAMVFTPRVILPGLVAAGVILFVAWLYYQFVSFALPPRLTIDDPQVDALVQVQEYTVRGHTASDAKISVTVFPGPDRYTDIRPAADGSFSVPLRLKPGPNHVEVEVLDSSGKVNSATRVIRVDFSAALSQGPQLILEQPANGATYTDGSVTVSGRVNAGVATLLVNGTPVKPESDGRFSLPVSFAPGEQLVRVVARSATGAEVQEQRAVNVTYTRAIVFVQVRGGSSWLLAVVDGAQDPRTNRVMPDGTTLTFTGQQVVVRAGNAGVTFLTYNGRDVGAMGEMGSVVEKSFGTP
jgi:cytoskeletal protein RodZ